MNKMSILSITATMLVPLAGLRAAEAQARLPNIIYILADDLGYGDVQCNNPQGKIPTPNIDRLAKEGMRFTDAHSGSAVCTPTRYGILTGRYDWRTRLQNGVLDNYVKPLIAKDRLTVPALLKQHRYATACLGKWHLGFTIEKTGKEEDQKVRSKTAGTLMGVPLGSRTLNGPVTRGFDVFYGFHHARMMESVFENDRVTELVQPVEMLPRLANRAAELVAVQAKTEKPFFLYLALNSPHTPIVPAKEWQGKSGLGDYGDYVMETDWAVGQVLAAIEKSGQADNTLVIFASDNGCSPAAGVGKLEEQGHFPSAGWRGYKADIWDGGHRIPFIVRWPAQVKAGSTSDQIVCLADLMATCAEITGTKLPDTAGEDSVSILPILKGTAQVPVREAVVHHSSNGSFSLRQGDWKLELCAGSGGWSGPKPGSQEAKKLPPIQLYNLAKDPGEKTNVQAENPEVVKRLTALLEKYIADGRSTPGAPQKNDVKIKLYKGNPAAAKE